LFTPYRFVVDASDEAKFPEAKEELHQLMAKPQLANIPLLVLGNKNDLPNAVVDEDTLKQLLYVGIISGPFPELSNLSSQPPALDITPCTLLCNG
jgi:ADP-ribosylation factor-like protein 8